MRPFRRVNTSLALAIGAAVLACASEAPRRVQIRIAPLVQITGQGALVHLSVVDARPPEQVEREPGALGGRIETQEELVAHLEQVVSEGLAKLGFSPTSDSTVPRRFTLELRNAETRVDHMPTHRRFYALARIDARSEGTLDDLYEGSYRSETTVNVSEGFELGLRSRLPALLILGELTLEERQAEVESSVTLVVWDALQKMFADAALFGPLIEEPSSRN